MQVDTQRVLDNARRAETKDLLDRVTVFRDAMTPESLEIIEAELAGRGVTPEDIHRHHQELKHRVVRDKRDLPVRCSFCHRAAVEWKLGWHKLLGLLPLFKRPFYYCDDHWAEASKPDSAQGV